MTTQPSLSFRRSVSQSTFPLTVVSIDSSVNPSESRSSRTAAAAKWLTRLLGPLASFSLTNSTSARSASLTGGSDGSFINSNVSRSADNVSTRICSDSISARLFRRISSTESTSTFPGRSTTSPCSSAILSARSSSSAMSPTRV